MELQKGMTSFQGLDQLFPADNLPAPR
jgi:hypothetical protein